MELDWETISSVVTSAALQIGAGFVLYIVGRWLIGFAVGILGRVLTARNFDPTLQRYIASILSVVLNIVLVVAILGFFGIETTSFAALLAGVGLAVGAALLDAFLQIGQRWCSARVGEGLIADLRRELFAKVQSLPAHS